MKIIRHFKTLFLITTYLLLTITEQNYAQWSNDPTINTPISTGISNSGPSKIVSDGAGGAIIMWWDDRNVSSNIDIYAQRINASGIVQWTVDGIAINTESAGLEFPEIVSDGLGGAIITWADDRFVANDFDIFAQRINGAGKVQWTEGGVSICTAIDAQISPKIISDGEGGATITWIDSRNSGRDNFNTDIYAQRINAIGNVQWSANGAAICTEINGQIDAMIISNGLGGAIITWSDIRNSNTTNWDIYAQNVNASGIVQWNADGTAICTANGFDGHPTMESDGLGGAIITWKGLHGGSLNIYAQGINASGIVQWTSDGVLICTDYSNGTLTIISAGSGGAIITWTDARNFSNTKFDIYAQRINTSGIVQWTANGVAVCEEMHSQQYFTIVSDNAGGAIITWVDDRNGSTNNDIYAQRINASGIAQWSVDGAAISTANFDQTYPDIVSDGLGGAIITWTDFRSGVDYDIYAQKYPTTSPLQITKPTPYSKFIAGETDTIKWTGGKAGQVLQIEYSEDNGSTYNLIDIAVPADSNYFVWDIPAIILTRKAKIKITDLVDSTITAVSDSFRIKPYVLTRLNPDSTYYSFIKNRDQWGFSNIQIDMWPVNWYNQFDYQGIDSFTNSTYSQWQADSAFAYSKRSDHMDWVSWVNTFSIDACYHSTFFGIYKTDAVLKWYSKTGNWFGSCFGIATANAISFVDSQGFKSKYPEFPNFVNPINVVSNNEVRKIINELFTYQWGNPHLAHTLSNFKTRTPNQTLDDIKQMLKEDNCQIATLSIFNNNGPGGHNILPYSLIQDTLQSHIYYLFVYDNANPTTNNPITFNTLSNGGQGSWNTPDWVDPTSGLPWGGSVGIILMDKAINYLPLPSLPKVFESTSPFILDDDVVEIFNNQGTEIIIKNSQQEAIGFQDGEVIQNLNGGVPLIALNGSQTPPYGYSLPIDNYSVVLNEFTGDSVETFFFTGNKSFVYERSGATQTQTDRLFFDGGVSAANPDAQTKTIKLLNLINETTQEKLAVVRSIELAQNDSVKIENPDSNKVKLISYGTAKEYDLELNYVTENGIGRFGDFNISLDANTSHTFVPVWTDITNTELQVLVDIGNDGIIDDTLSLVNQVTGIGEDQGSLLTPNSYNLAQNYPNPFNPTTKISWQSPVGSHQTLKVYDVLGNEVATLVDEFREAGRYEITFDASSLSSGIYFYRLQVGSFVESKKMILIK